MILLCKKLIEHLIKLNQLFVKTSGNKNGEPLVMIHGWGMNSSAWENVRTELESQFSMYWVDLPGYGSNSRVSANSMNEIVDLIIQEIPLNFHLLGWSLGGLVAQAIAHNSFSSNNHTNQIKSLSMVATTPKFSLSSNWENGVSKKTLNKFSNNLVEDVEGTLKRFIALQFMGIKGIKESKKIQKALIDKILTNSEYKSAKKGGGGIENIDESVHFKALTLGLKLLNDSDYRRTSYDYPQQWIFSDRDRLIPPAVTNDLKLLRPNDQITLIENSGHAPFMTHPKVFLNLIIPFINQNA